MGWGNGAFVDAFAVPVVVLVALAGTAGYLAGAYRAYGRPRGWQGQVTLLVPAVGWALVVYAVWPLPAVVDGMCAPHGGAPLVPAPGATLFPLAPEAVPGTGPALAPGWRAAVAMAVFVPVGTLAWYRFRRGWLTTLGVGLGLAAAVEAVQASAVAGLYPCAYRVAALDDVLFGGAGALLGWAVAVPLSRRLPRGWPAAVPDLLPPGLARRLAATALDLGLWWYGAAVTTGVLLAVGVPLPAVAASPHPLTPHPVALVALAAALGVAVPALTASRVTCGGLALALALGRDAPPGPALRWRAALRSALLYGPVAALFAAGLPWWSLLAVAVHAAPMLVRPDRRGLLDLVCGTRVATRASVRGGLPTRTVRVPATAGTP